MSMLDEKDPAGADRLQTWIEGLRNAEPGVAPTFHILRMIHPGLQPLLGNGLVGVEPLSVLHVPGEDASAVSLLRYITAGTESRTFDLHGQAAMLGALLTLVTDRRCQVAPEVFAKVDGQEDHFAIPVTGQVDSTLGAPMPAWEQIDPRFREVVARLTSLSNDDMAAVSAAIHMHYCAALLLTRDLAGAYALTVGGIECLAQRFGNPPTEWQEWDKAAGWEKFITKHQLSAQQAEALRGRLMKDQHIKLAETFATYATNRLPEGFWAQPVRSYQWGIKADPAGAHPIEGSWSEPQPLGPEFADDPGKAKAAFKTAYQLRSGFLHAGKREVTFIRDAFHGALPANGRDSSPGDKARLTMAQLRAVLRSLIIRELVERGDPDPKGLEETCVLTTLEH
ncbi:hypothetical protein ACGFJ4_16580 [Micromonospora chalcea]|uniref:hypothetical protein n=1 Tax=Micromonospora chalcea TaxID=1874 RepID=UPI003711D4A1